MRRYEELLNFVKVAVNLNKERNGQKYRTPKISRQRRFECPEGSWDEKVNLIRNLINMFLSLTSLKVPSPESKKIKHKYNK